MALIVNPDSATYNVNNADLPETVNYAYSIFNDLTTPKPAQIRTQFQIVSLLPQESLASAYHLEHLSISSWSLVV